RLRQANRLLSRLQSGTQRTGSTSVGQAPANSVATGLDRAPVQSTSTPASVGLRPGTGTTAGTSKVPGGPPGAISSTNLGNSTSADDRDSRLRNLENKLEKLLKEVEALRREVRRPQSGSSSSVPTDSNAKNPETPKR